MNGNNRAHRIHIRILTHEETRFWHSRFNRRFREIHQTDIVSRCEQDARHCGFAGFAIYDAYETLVAQGQITPAA